MIQSSILRVVCSKGHSGCIVDNVGELGISIDPIVSVVHGRSSYLLMK